MGGSVIPVHSSCGIVGKFSNAPAGPEAGETPMGKGGWRERMESKNYSSLMGGSVFLKRPSRVTATCYCHMLLIDKGSPVKSCPTMSFLPGQLSGFSACHKDFRKRVPL